MREVPLQRSALLTDAGFVHGFSTRRGGVSEAPFDSLNLGRALGDAASKVEENHRRLAASLGYARLFELSQVHGVRVRNVRAGEDARVVRAEEGDALIAREPGIAVGVRTADCIPLLLAHRHSGHVAAVHAGWRGVEAKIAAQAIKELGHPASELVAALGPHIRQANFEVGEDVAERLAAASDARDVVDRSDTPHVDLTQILIAQLRALGVSDVDDAGGCTYADQAYFSYRRDGARTGRMLSVIVAGTRA